jgi:hypothetical protein
VASPLWKIELELTPSISCSRVPYEEKIQAVFAMQMTVGLINIYLTQTHK